MSVIEQIKDYFRNKGLKQTEIANECGWKSSFVSELLNGKRTIGDETAIKLNKVYGFNLHWLLTGEGSMFATDATATSIAEAEKRVEESEEIAELKKEIEFLKGIVSTQKATIDRLLSEPQPPHTPRDPRDGMLLNEESDVYSR